MVRRKCTRRVEAGSPSASSLQESALGAPHALSRTRSTPLATPPPAILRINVLPMGDIDRELNPLLVVEIEADAPLSELKRRVHDRMTKMAKAEKWHVWVHVIGLFLAKTNDSTSPSLPLDAVDAADAQSVAESCVCRDNFLRMESTASSCLTSQDCVNVVALVLAPLLNQSELMMRSSVDYNSAKRSKIFENFVHSEITDRTLPRTPTGPTRRVFIRHDYVKLFGVIRETLSASSVDQESKLLGSVRQRAIRAETKDEYELEACDERQVEYDSEESEEKTAVMVTGTPGVGKSAFLWFLLHQLSLTRPVVFNDGITIALVRPDGTITMGSKLEAFSYELAQRNTVYLMDACRRAPPTLEIHASTIIVTSPVPPLIKKYVNSFLQPAVLYMPLWTLEELEECRSNCFASSVEPESVSTLFQYFGGVARNTLVHRNHVQSSIDQLTSKINFMRPDRVDANLDSAGKRGAIDTKDGLISHELLHIATTNYKTTVLVFASKFACDQLVQKNAQFVRKTLRKLLSASAHEPMIATARGHLFESYAHHLLEAGGMFTVKKLAPGCATTATSELALPPADRRVFDQVRLIPTDETVYAVPRAKNFPAFDAIVLPNKLFQMTVSLDHKVLHQAAEDVCDTLTSMLPVKKQKTRATQKKQTPPRFKLYFVVPDDKFSDFKYQNYLTSKKTTMKSPSVPIDQYALRIDL